MQKYKSIFTVAVLVIFMVPQVALAAWWNPLSWGVWNIFRPTPKVQQIEIATTTPATPAIITTKKAEANQKQDAVKDNKSFFFGSPKKQVAISTKEEDKPKVETPKVLTINLPSGAVIEMDTNGNILRTIEEAPRQVYIPPVSATSQTQDQATPPPIVSPVQTPQPLSTPTPSCTQDTWGCSDWATCSSSGSQTRTCNKTFECTLAVTPQPITSQSCTPQAPSCQTDTWSCGNWNSCSDSGNQTRSCTKTFDCSLVATPTPSTSQSCTPPTPTPTPPSNPVVVYSDYNFNYQWTSWGGGASTLSCPMTPRNIVIKKAVFEISDSELQKITTLRALEADGFEVILPGPLTTLRATHQGSTYSNSYGLEEIKPNTFVYFGGDIPICASGGVVSINENLGYFMDIAGGRNVKVYLDQKGITMEVNSIGNGVSFYLHVTPIMTDWEVWDYTTNKPVKIN